MHFNSALRDFDLGCGNPKPIHNPRKLSKDDTTTTGCVERQPCSLRFEPIRLTVALHIGLRSISGADC